MRIVKNDAYIGATIIFFGILIVYSYWLLIKIYNLPLYINSNTAALFSLILGFIIPLSIANIPARYLIMRITGSFMLVGSLFVLIRWNRLFLTHSLNLQLIATGLTTSLIISGYLVHEKKWDLVRNVSVFIIGIIGLFYLDYFKYLYTTAQYVNEFAISIVFITFFIFPFIMYRMLIADR